MSSTDVEKTLRELRERVRAQIYKQAPGSSPQSARHGQLTSHSQLTEAAIESLRANLSVTQRSWNKLPPLTSYRTGWVARLELWCKRCLERASHWFTWEQVNFNSATSNSLKEVLSVLCAHEEVLVELKKQLAKIASAAPEVQTKLETLSTNGPRALNSFDTDRAPDDKPDAIRVNDNRDVSSPEQPRLIDSEIKHQ